MRPFTILRARQIDDNLHILLLSWYVDGKENIVRADGYEYNPTDTLTQFNASLLKEEKEPLTTSEEFLIKLLMI